MGHIPHYPKLPHIADGNHLKIAENFNCINGIRYLRGSRFKYRYDAA